MEPLSVTASVCGILAMAAKITRSLIEFVRKEKAAPASAHRILNEVSNLSLCLKRLQPFIQGIKKSSQSRTAMISGEDVVVITASCVTVLDDLDKTLDPFRLSLPLSTMRRIRWVQEEAKIDDLIARVQVSKTSLNLVLTILNWSVILSIIYPD